MNEQQDIDPYDAHYLEQEALRDAGFKTIDDLPGSYRPQFEKTGGTSGPNVWHWALWGFPGRRIGEGNAPTFMQAAREMMDVANALAAARSGEGE